MTQRAKDSTAESLLAHISANLDKLPQLSDNLHTDNGSLGPYKALFEHYASITSTTSTAFQEKHATTIRAVGSALESAQAHLVRLIRAENAAVFKDCAQSIQQATQVQGSEESSYVNHDDVAQDLNRGLAANIQKFCVPGHCPSVFCTPPPPAPPPPPRPCPATRRVKPRSGPVHGLWSMVGPRSIGARSKV